MPLLFGIPTLDELIDIPASNEQPRSSNKARASTPHILRTDATSMSVLGPDGSGKSVLALHLASKYRAWCSARLKPSDKLPLILYVSSDLQFESAYKVWSNFRLDRPFDRHIPFERMPAEIDRRLIPETVNPRQLEIELRPIEPGNGSDVRFLLPSRPEKASDKETSIAFLDLARNTAGDDWKFVNSLIVSLEAFECPKYKRVPTSHLVIIDSVAGFETYMGTYDAYGMEQTRRARIAQSMRNAGKHAHLVFVVEEPEDGKRLPEEYVTDVVVRLRARKEGGRTLRTVEIEKARARNHAVGEHTFEIRNRKGSSTGRWENPDTPVTNNAYVHVFHSLSHRNLLVATTPGEGKLEKEPAQRQVAPFGVHYLDRLLEQERHGPEESRRWGIRAGSTVAIIGDASTGKSLLGEKFLAQGFSQMAEDAIRLYFLLSRGLGAEQKPGGRSRKALSRICGELAPSKEYPPPDRRVRIKPRDVVKTIARAWLDGEEVSAQVLRKTTGQNPHRATRNLPVGSVQQRRVVLEKRKADKDLMNPRKSRLYCDADLARFGNQTDPVKQLVELFRHPNLRRPGILLTTGDRTVNFLAQRCLGYLADTIDHCVRDCIAESKPTDKSKPTDQEVRLAAAAPLKALLEILEEQLIVRRFDIDTITADALFDLIQRNVVQAEYLLHGPYFPTGQTPRYNKADRIRLVIDDMRVLSNLCLSVSKDSAFLPFLVFHLERVGLTSLIIHSDGLRPGAHPEDPVSQELLSLLHQLILTWSVPFEGQSRIAISATPAASKETNGIVREIEISYPGPPKILEGVVDTELPKVDVTRHLELYADLEIGKPRLVPLAVYLFAATEACRNYMEREDALYRAQFLPVPGLLSKDGTKRVLWPIDAQEYYAIRDLTHLPWDVKAGYTIVDQVGGFWSLDAETGALASQYDYLTARNPGGSGTDHEDPFGLFRGKPLHFNEHRRANDPGPPYNRSLFFQNSGYRSRIVNFTRNPGRSERMPDRVPFMWDFAFILAPTGPWDRASGSQIPYSFKPKDTAPLSVGQTLSDLREPSWKRRGVVPWRRFLGACRVVADEARRDRSAAPVAFDFAATSAETLLSVFLEIWFSEITLAVKAAPSHTPERQTWKIWLERLSNPKYEPLTPASNEARFYSLKGLLKSADDPSISAAFRSLRSGYAESVKAYWGTKQDAKSKETRNALNRHWKKNARGPRNPELVTEAFVRWESDPESEPVRRELFQKLPTAALCLYKTWLLLQDVFDFEAVLDPASAFEIRQPKEASGLAVAARHYYRTACDAQSLSAEGKDTLPASSYILAMPGFFSSRGDSFLASAQASRSQLLASHAIDLLCSRRANLTRMQMGMGLPVRDVLEPEQCSEMRTALRATTRDGTPEQVKYAYLSGLGGCPPWTADDGEKSRWLFRNGVPEYDRVSLAMQKWLIRLFEWTVPYRARHVLGWDGGFHGYDALASHRFSPFATFDSFDEFGKLCDYLVAELGAAERQEP